MSAPLSTECNNSLTGKTLKDNTPALAEAMGLSQKCQKLGSSEFATGSLSGSASIPFVKLSAQAGFTQSNNKMKEEGCGQFFLNAKNITDTMNTMACTVSNHTNTSDTDVQNDASINININISPEYLKNLAVSRAEAQKTLDSISLALTNATISGNSNLSVDKIKALQSTQQKVLESFAPPINIIKNDKFISKSGGKVVTSIEIDESEQQKLATNYKNIANASATNHLQTQLGVNALDPSTKSVLEQNVTNATNNVQNTISTTVNGAKLNVNSSSSITINSNIPIDIENTVFDANALVNIVVSHLTKNAVSDGINAANNLLADASSTTDSSATSAGVDKLAKELANIQKTQEDNAGGGSGFAWYVYLILGIIILAIIGGIMYAIKNSDKISKAIQTARTPKL